MDARLLALSPPLPPGFLILDPVPIPRSGIKAKVPDAVRDWVKAYHSILFNTTSTTHIICRGCEAMEFPASQIRFRPDQRFHHVYARHVQRSLKCGACDRTFAGSSQQLIHDCAGQPIVAMECDMFWCGVKFKSKQGEKNHYEKPVHKAMNLRFGTVEEFHQKIQHAKKLEKEAGPTYLDAFLALDADSCVWAGRLPDDQPRFLCRVFDDESAITFPSSPFYGKDERSKAYQYDRFCGPCSGVEIGRVGDQYISELLEGRLGFTHDQALFWCDPGRHKGQPYIALILARLFPYYESPAELFEQWYCNTERYVQQTDPSEKQYPWDDYSYYDKDQHEGSVVENAVDKLDFDNRHHKAHAVFNDLLIIVAGLGISFLSFYRRAMTIRKCGQYHRSMNPSDSFIRLMNASCRNRLPGIHPFTIELWLWHFLEEEASVRYGGTLVEYWHPNGGKRKLPAWSGYVPIRHITFTSARHVGSLDAFRRPFCPKKLSANLDWEPQVAYPR